MSGNNNLGRGGFQYLDPERQRQIASQGGRAAHASGNAHQWTSAEASTAAKKGHANRKARKAAEAQSRSNDQRGADYCEGRSSWPGTVDSSDGGAY